MVFATIVPLEKTAGFHHLGRRQIPDRGNARVDALVEPAKIKVAGDVRHPVQPDDRPVPTGGHHLNLFIFIELVIDGLDPFQGAAGIFIGKHNDPLDITQLFPGRGLKADIEGDVLPAGNPPGVAEHLDHDLTGDPVVGFQEEFPGVGEGGDFRAEPGQ